MDLTWNLYQILKTGEIDEEEMAIESELESTMTLEETKKITHHIEQENSNNQEYSENNVILEILNKIITEVLGEEKFEVWNIN